MQLALFQPPPVERRRKSGSPRVGTSACPFRTHRRERLVDAPPRSDPRLSFLEKPRPSSAELDLEVRGDQVDDIAAAIVDARAGKRTRPHPTRGRKLPPEVFSEAEVRALIGACSMRGKTGVRNRALLSVLWRTGIRISEALDLRPHDVDFERGTVRVRRGKGLKPRTTVLSNLDAVPLLRTWLNVRGQLDAVGQGAALFCTLKGTSTQTSYMRHLLPRLAQRAGLERRVHPHALRHTHAADLALADVPVLAIQAQLGHASLVTTAAYLRRVGVRLDVVAAIRSTPRTGASW